MKWNSKFISFIIRIALLIILSLNVLKYSYNFINIFGVFIILSMVAANDFYRTRVIDRSGKKIGTNLSILLSVLLIGLLGQLIGTDFTKIYAYLTIPEVVQIQLNKKNKWLILVIFLLFCLFYIKMMPIDLNALSSVLKSFIYTDLIPFWSIFFISYLHLNLLYNNQKINDLNAELIEKVDQLQNYSEKIKEIATLQERQRISQQLHDMLGHSLVALKLHLEAASDIIDEDIEQAKALLKKSEEIIDQSFLELKATVSELNNEFDTDGLSAALEGMALRFSLINNLNVSYSIETDLEKLASSYKEMIFNISRESLTNSLRHGQSTNVAIKIAEKRNILTLVIVNNGYAPKELTASNGLNGMKKRVIDLGGEIQFISGKIEGLTTKVAVPLKDS